MRLKSASTKHHEMYIVDIDDKEDPYRVGPDGTPARQHRPSPGARAGTGSALRLAKKLSDAEGNAIDTI